MIPYLRAAPVAVQHLLQMNEVVVGCVKYTFLIVVDTAPARLLRV